MSEEIKKEAQDAKLNPEELDKVAGGVDIVYPDDPDRPKPKCPYCGSELVIRVSISAWTPFCKNCNREIKEDEGLL